jgi:hypothetical protein
MGARSIQDGSNRNAIAKKGLVDGKVIERWSFFHAIKVVRERGFRKRRRRWSKRRVGVGIGIQKDIGGGSDRKTDRSNGVDAILVVEHG